MTQLNVHSIFRSIDGEITPCSPQGRLSTFIRLAGCNLSCDYCDTERAQSVESGKMMTIDEVMEEVFKFPTIKITITGGEPLLQKQAVTELMKALWIQGRVGLEISIETNGSIPLPPGWETFTGFVVDYKLPSSGMETMMMKEQEWVHLSKGVVVKFVIQDGNDFARAAHIQRKYQSRGCQALFAYSPAHESLDPADLVKWMKSSGLDCSINLQLHKIIWPGAEDEV